MVLISVVDPAAAELYMLEVNNYIYNVNRDYDNAVIALAIINPLLDAYFIEETIRGVRHGFYPVISNPGYWITAMSVLMRLEIIQYRRDLKLYDRIYKINADINRIQVDF